MTDNLHSTDQNAAKFGFSPRAKGVDNTAALQHAVDQGGTIIVDQPGTYDIAGTVYIGSHTSILFGHGVTLRKVTECGGFTHVLLNRGALTKTYDHHITIRGLRLKVNQVDQTMDQIYGLRGQIAFFYVKDLCIEQFRCDDLMSQQFAIHVCTFEDVRIQDVIIRGGKDGVHLGRGRRFVIRDGVFQTHDDAIALNAHDYATSNPELGWIEDGVIERCHDLAESHGQQSTGFFCRMLAGAWTDWQFDMQVQHSDTVVSHGRLYRVQAQPDGKIYTSKTQPAHQSGDAVLDGIRWGVVQDDITYTAAVKNVAFRDIFLHNPRTSFSLHFDKDRYSRSYYPDSPIPVQRQILLDNVRVLHDQPTPFMAIGTPVDVVNLTHCSLKQNSLVFRQNDEAVALGSTHINLSNCVFEAQGDMEILKNMASDKRIVLTTYASVTLHDNFLPIITAGPGKLIVCCDLKELE